MESTMSSIARFFYKESKMPIKKKAKELVGCDPLWHFFFLKINNNNKIKNIKKMNFVKKH
jgi:hypothetical protein